MIHRFKDAPDRVKETFFAASVSAESLNSFSGRNTLEKLDAESDKSAPKDYNLAKTLSNFFNVICILELVHLKQALVQVLNPQY